MDTKVQSTSCSNDAQLGTVPQITLMQLNSHTSTLTFRKTLPALISSTDCKFYSQIVNIPISLPHFRSLKYFQFHATSDEHVHTFHEAKKLDPINERMLY